MGTEGQETVENTHLFLCTANRLSLSHTGVAALLDATLLVGTTLFRVGFELVCGIWFIHLLAGFLAMPFAVVETLVALLPVVAMRKECSSHASSLESLEDDTWLAFFGGIKQNYYFCSVLLEVPCGLANEQIKWFSCSRRCVYTALKWNEARLESTFVAPGSYVFEFYVTGGQPKYYCRYHWADAQRGLIYLVTSHWWKDVL